MRKYQAVKSGLGTLLILAVLSILSGHLEAQDGIPWMKDLQQAKARAAAENKLVLIHFWGASCRPCQKLESFVFSNTTVQQSIMDTAIPVKIEDEAHPELFKEFGVQSIPQDVVITPDGKVVMKRISPQTTDGYRYMMKKLAEMNKLQSRVASANDQVSKLRQDLEIIKQRNREIVQQNLTKQGKQFAPNENGKVFERSATAQSFKPKNITNQFVVEVPKVDKPSVPAPQHEMPSPQQIGQQQSEKSTTGPLDSVAKDNLPIDPNPLRPIDQVKKKVVNNQYFQPAGQFNPLAPQQSEMKSAASDPLKGSTAAKPHQKTIQNSLVPASDVAQSKPKTSFRKTPKAQMGGYCPVTLLTESKWQAGDKRWGCFHRGKLFLFVSKQKRDLFMSKPDQFSPLLASHDPMEYLTNGNLVAGQIQSGVVIDEDGQKMIVLFASEKSKTAFKADPKKFLSQVKTSAARTAKRSTDSANSKIR